MSYIAIQAKHTDLRRVRRALRRAGYDAYLPALSTRRAIIKASKRKVRRKITPLMSYIFIPVPKDEKTIALWLHGITETKGVTGYVRTHDGFGRVPDAAILDLKDKIKGMRFEIEASRHRRKIKIGAKAIHAKAGKVGTVQWIRGKSAGFEAKLFGAMRTIVVKAKDLEAA